MLQIAAVKAKPCVASDSSPSLSSHWVCISGMFEYLTGWECSRLWRLGLCWSTHTTFFISSKLGSEGTMSKNGGLYSSTIPEKTTELRDFMGFCQRLLTTLHLNFYWQKCRCVPRLKVSSDHIYKTVVWEFGGWQYFYFCGRMAGNCPGSLWAAYGSWHYGVKSYSETIKKAIILHFVIYTRRLYKEI